MIHLTSSHSRRSARNLLVGVTTILGARHLSAQSVAAPVVFHVKLGQASSTPVSDDPWGLYKTIAREMYSLARPESKARTR